MNPTAQMTSRHASVRCGAGQSVVTVRISPIAAVDKARLLERLDWRVHITNSAGHRFDSPDFDRLLFITAQA
jgi:hypothetical protein